MFNVLSRAIAFTFILFLAVFLKKIGFVPKNSGEAFKKVLIYITLPAAIISNFSISTAITWNIIIIILVGLFSNIIMMLLGMLIAINKNTDKKIIYSMCLPSYNIGAFCLPFVQSFLPPIATVTASMFDIGNCVMCTGGTYSIVSEYIDKDNKGINIKNIIKNLLTSPPLVTYLSMFIISLLNIKIPQIILNFLDPMAKANTFVAMFMLGLLFHLELKKDYIIEMFIILSSRLAFSAITGALIYYFLPFDVIIKQALILTLFSPIGSVTPYYTGLLKGDEGKASCANSLSIIMSLISITLLLSIMNIN